MEQHKKVLGIIYIVTASLTILTFLALSALLSTIFSFAAEQVSSDEAIVLQLIKQIVSVLLWLIITFISVPSIIAGVGLLNNQRWAMTMALILGCLKLLSFPIGTAIGVYSIWVYLESNKQQNTTNS